MGALISVTRGANKILLYASISVFFISLIVLFGMTYFITGKPFGTEIPSSEYEEITFDSAISVSASFALLCSVWLFCPIIMIVSLVLIGIFAILNTGLSSGK